MQGIAEVHRPDTNCGASTQGLRELPSWLAEATAEGEDPAWDCVHLNCELRNLAALRRDLLRCRAELPESNGRGWVLRGVRAEPDDKREQCCWGAVGIHDVKCPDRDGKNATPIEQYTSNLREILRLLKPRAKRIIW